MSLSARAQSIAVKEAVNEELVRSEARKLAAEAADAEQQIRSIANFTETELCSEVRRHVGAAQADRDSTAEHAEQITSPRRPAAGVAAAIGEVTEAVARRGNQQAALTAMAQEQAIRSTQEFRESSVNVEARRAVAAKDADKAVAQEQAERISRDWIEREVCQQVRRHMAAAEADRAVAAEHAEQARAPRRPSAEIAAAIGSITEEVARTGNQRDAITAMEEEQQIRSVQEFRESTLNVEARRAVAAKVADIACSHEQDSRVQEEWLRAEVAPELFRATNARVAKAAVTAEQAELAETPRRPSVEVARRKASVNAAIDGAEILSATSG